MVETLFQSTQTSMISTVTTLGIDIELYWCNETDTLLFHVTRRCHVWPAEAAEWIYFQAKKKNKQRQAATQAMYTST